MLTNKTIDDITTKRDKLLLVSQLLIDDSSDEEIAEDIILQTAFKMVTEEVSRELMLRTLHPLKKRLPDRPVYHGNYLNNIVPKLSDMEFLLDFRLTRSCIQSLTERLACTTPYQQLKRNGAFDVLNLEQYILVFLRLTGHLETRYRDVAKIFNIAPRFIHDIVSRVTDMILEMEAEVLVRPDVEKQNRTAEYFYIEYGFPNVIGCIGASHIRVDRPPVVVGCYLNEFGYHSIQLQAIVDETLRFIDVSSSFPGSMARGVLFSESEVYSWLPEMCGDDYHIAGDSRFPCLPKLMVPFNDDGTLTPAQKMFNAQLNRFQVVVEKAFSCLRKRFQHLYFLRARNIKRVNNLIKACCILHNLAPLEDLENFATSGNEELPLAVVQSNEPICLTTAGFNQLNQLVIAGDKRRRLICDTYYL